MDAMVSGAEAAGVAVEPGTVGVDDDVAPEVGWAGHGRIMRYCEVVTHEESGAARRSLPLPMLCPGVEADARYPDRSASIGFTFAAEWAGQKPKMRPERQETLRERAMLEGVIMVGQSAQELMERARP